MLHKKYLALATATLLFATTAHATVYDITGIIDTTSSGFGSTLFHDQKGGQMSGSEIADPTSLISSGSWDSVTGEMDFSMNMDGGGTVSATGDIDLSARADSTLGYTGIFGTLVMTFSSVTGIADGAYTFIFRDAWHNPEANGFLHDQHISLWGDVTALWGDSSRYSKRYCRHNFCMGGDFRLAITETSPVPIPGSFGLLALGLGGLIARRRLSKKPA